MHRKLAVDALLRLVPAIHGHHPRREHEEVDLGDAPAQLARDAVHVLHQRYVALDELVLHTGDRRRREGREDGLGRGTVAADDNDVRVAFGMAGKGFCHALPDARCPADENCHRGVRRGEGGVEGANGGEGRHGNEFAVEEEGK